MEQKLIELQRVLVMVFTVVIFTHILSDYVRDNVNF